MVYNPPIEKGADGSAKAEEVALSHPVNPMRRGAYVEQATRAAGWAIMYVIGWLLMRLSCHVGLPDDCNLPSKPLEVLTDLLVLLVFALAQVSHNKVLRGRRASATHTASGLRLGSMQPGLTCWCGLSLFVRWRCNCV